MLIETIRFTTNITMYTKVSDKHFAELRALRVLRDENLISYFAMAASLFAHS